jgi:hypothetical protein
MHSRPVEPELLVDMAKGPDTQVVEWIVTPNVHHGCYMGPPKGTWKLGRGQLLRGLRQEATFARSQIELEGMCCQVTLELVRLHQPAFIHWLEDMAAGVAFEAHGITAAADSFVLEIAEAASHPRWSLGLQETFVISFSNLCKAGEVATAVEIVLVPRQIVVPSNFPGWPR